MTNVSSKACTTGNGKDVNYVGRGVSFRRIRRVTGYLSDISHMNDAKRHEVSERKCSSVN